MSQAIHKQQTTTDAKRIRLLMSMWLASGEAATVSFHEWNKKRINRVVSKWFK